MIPVFWRYLRMPSRIPLSVLLAVLIFAPSPGVRAQASPGLSEVVTDPPGGAAANVSVTATNKGTHPVNFTVASFKTPGIEWASINVFGTAGVNRVQTRDSAPAAPPAASDALTWHGITLYGAYDIGVGWVSHGLPENGYNYEGASLVNRNGYQNRFLVAPNNLQQTGLGVRGREEFQPGWAVVFNASSGINPQSGLLANASATQTINNGLPRKSYSYAIDGARAGQPFNDEIYGGVSSEHFGTLTFGRQRSLGTDAMLLYDPANGGYAFSYIGYNGTMAGGGDTENSRWDSAVKYRFTYGPVHFGAMYKFADGNGGCYSASATWTAANCTPESAHNNAFGFDGGGSHGKLSADMVFQLLQPGDQRIEPLAGASKCDAVVSVDHQQHQYKPHHRGQSDPNDQYRIWHRDRQQGHYGRGEVYVGSVQVLWRLRIHLAE